MERLSRFYESDANVFSLIIVRYSTEGTRVAVSAVLFSPIEFLDWDCLTIGALGWGRIQISNSNDIRVIDGYSRKNWMLRPCRTMLEFYPREILKIKGRMDRFSTVMEYWERKDDIWT